MQLRDVQAHHARYLASMRRSPHTITYYSFALEPLYKFLEERGHSGEADEISTVLLREYQVWLREVRGLKPGGEHGSMRGVRAVLRWAADEELISKDPTRKLRLGAPRTGKPPAVQPDEVKRCLTVVEAMPRPLRNKAIILCLYDTGVRMGELLGLHAEDLDMAGGTITVRGETSKSRKGRVIPLGVKTARALLAYERRERRPAVPHVQQLFLSRTGEPMTKGGLTHVMVSLAEAAELPRSHVAPHAWRRGFATQYLRNGGDLFALQQLLGHSTLEMTRRYVNYLPDDLRRGHSWASPVDGLRRQR